jgi:hypothetical protein
LEQSLKACFFCQYFFIGDKKFLDLYKEKLSAVNGGKKPFYLRQALRWRADHGNEAVAFSRMVWKWYPAVFKKMCTYKPQPR